VSIVEPALLMSTSTDTNLLTAFEDDNLFIVFDSFYSALLHRIMVDRKTQHMDKE